MVALFSACDADRDNPFDPQSPFYKPDQQPDRVIDLALDSLTESNARLVWTSPEGAEDYLLFSGLPDWDTSDTSRADRYIGELPGVKPPGSRQHVWIQLPEGQTRAWSLFSISESDLLSDGSNVAVIAAPKVDQPASVAVTIRSKHHATWEALDYYSIEIQAEIIDPDTVDLVWLRKDTLDFGTLLPTGDGINYSREFVETQLPGFRLGELIGYPLTIYHLDKAGFVTATNEIYIVRIIYDVPEVLSPDGDIVLNDSIITLEWNYFDADYDFTYSAEIWHSTVDHGDSIVYFTDNIPSYMTENQVTKLLPEEANFLFWRILVTDDFGDVSRSLEGRFRVDYR